MRTSDARIYPFAPVQPAGAEQPVLCIDESALSDDPDGTKPLFDDSGAPASILGQVQTFMADFLQHRRVTRQAAAHLRAANLLVPWALQAQRDDGTEQPLEGLWKVDEAALKHIVPAPITVDTSTGRGITKPPPRRSSPHPLPKPSLRSIHPPRACWRLAAATDGMRPFLPIKATRSPRWMPVLMPLRRSRPAMPIDRCACMPVSCLTSPHTPSSFSA